MADEPVVSMLPKCLGVLANPRAFPGCLVSLQYKVIAASS
jgi:hypothetical protein